MGRCRVCGVKRADVPVERAAVRLIVDERGEVKIQRNEKRLTRAVWQNKSKLSIWCRRRVRRKFKIGMGDIHHASAVGGLD